MDRKFRFTSQCFKSTNPLWILLFMCTAVSVHAQEFRWGASIAPQASWWNVEGDLYERRDTKIGVQLGIFAEQTLGKTERFALCSGLNYNLAPGGFVEAETGNNNGELKVWNFSLMSLDLPLLIKLRSDQLNRTVLFAQYGLTLGFTVLSSAKNESGGTAGKGVDYEGINSSLTMSVGGEYELQSSKTIQIGLFFQNGIRNMLIDNANDDDMYPQQIGIRTGLYF